MKDQWRIAGFGTPIGLDYTSVKVWADGLEIDLDRSILRKIKVLEQAELADMAIRSKGESAKPEAEIDREYCAECIKAKLNTVCPECFIRGKFVDG